LRSLRLAAACALSAAVLLLASPAFAHVEIESDDAEAGQASTMTVSVPNERDDAGTVKLDLRFPEDATLTDVTAAQTAGWTAAVSDTGIVWTGGPLTGEDKVELTFTATLPDDAEQLEFKALQTYDDGQVVRWIEATPEGGAEPEHPAPVLDLEGGGEDHHAEEGTETTVAGTPTTADEHAEGTDDEGAGSDASAAATENDDDGSSTGVVVLIVAVVVLAAGGGTYVVMRRRRAA
jgi:uncharacterized protein YcnI